MFSGWDRTRKIFAVIFIVSVLVVGSVAYSIGTSRPFGGEFEDVGIVEATGNLDRVQLFCVDVVDNGVKSTRCKHLWKIKVDSAELRQGETIASLPDNGDIITVEVEDSRANLFIELNYDECVRDSDPATSYQSAVRICDHTVTQDVVTVSLIEKIGSSGQPEWTGVPR